MTGSCAANRTGTIQVKGDAGTFHSPNYPYYHPTDMTCRWDITVTAGQVIELTTTTYQLNKDCSKQWVRIYDGPSTSSPVIIKLCASYTRSFFSSSNRAIVEFVTEGSTQSKGFYVTYSARMAKPKSYACSSARWPDKIDAFSGKIASDRFPLRYSNNARCWLQIKAPKVNYIVNLTFTSLDLEPDGDKCEKDYVQVGSNNYKLARLCGKKKTPLSFLSKFSNEMDITFWADAVGRYPGFDATFTSVQDRKKLLNPVLFVLTSMYFFHFRPSLFPIIHSFIRYLLTYFFPCISYLILYFFSRVPTFVLFSPFLPISYSTLSLLSPFLSHL